MEVTNYAYVIDGGAIVMEGPSQEIRRNEDVISHYLGQTRD
jgi:ABC-type branched-subunit amino acid transport system ATPase component